MKKNTKHQRGDRLIVICIMTLMLAVMLAGCGSKKVDGYYTCKTGGVALPEYFALEIHGDTATAYTSNRASGAGATVEKTKEGADLYFEVQPHLSWGKYNPLHAKLSENGKKMYLSSDNSDWMTDTYDVVSKKEFEAFIEEHIK